MKLPDSNEPQSKQPSEQPEPKHDNPSHRLRNILSSSDGEPPQARDDSPLAKLPKAASKAEPGPKPDFLPASSGRKAGEKKPVLRWEKILHAFWTVASVVSMLINVVLLAALLAVLQNVDMIQIPEGVDLGMGKDLLGGLYGNFEKMDAAHIKKDITVEAEIPVQFDLQLSQQTDVILSQDVTINGAYVSIDTALFDINAPATVTLPAGTVLPIILNLTVPVDTSIPISLDVPVDIALNETDLHEPFVGLQEVLEPLYCLVEPNATSLDDLPICP